MEFIPPPTLPELKNKALDHLLTCVCAALDADIAAVRKGHLTRSALDARGVFVVFACKLEYAHSDISSYLNIPGLNIANIEWSCNDNMVRRNPELRQKFNTVATAVFGKGDYVGTY